MICFVMVRYPDFRAELYLPWLCLLSHTYPSQLDHNTGKSQSTDDCNMPMGFHKWFQTLSGVGSCPPIPGDTAYSRDSCCCTLATSLMSAS